MNELKDLCERIVADAPPMPDSAGVLATARRQAARHRLVQFAVVGAAAVAVVAAAALTVSGPAHVGRGEHGPAVGGPVSAAAGRGTHAQKLFELLTRAVPGGYTVSPMTGSAGMFGVAQHSAGLWVADGHGRGQLAAAVVQTRGIQNSDLTNPCYDPPPMCEIVHVGDVAIKVSVGTFDNVGQNISASRWSIVEDGRDFVMVWAFQGAVEYPGADAVVVHPGVAVFPFTRQQIAELAASAEIFPPR